MGKKREKKISLFQFLDLWRTCWVACGIVANQIQFEDKKKKIAIHDNEQRAVFWYICDIHILYETMRLQTKQNRRKNINKLKQKSTNSKTNLPNDKNVYDTDDEKGLTIINYSQQMNATNSRKNEKKK